MPMRVSGRCIRLPGCICSLNLDWSWRRIWRIEVWRIGPLKFFGSCSGSCNDDHLRAGGRGRRLGPESVGQLFEHRLFDCFDGYRCPFHVHVHVHCHCHYCKNVPGITANVSLCISFCTVTVTVTIHIHG
jgi:hypothetical protein